MVSNISNKVGPSEAIQAVITIIRSSSLSFNFFLHKVQNSWYSFGIVYSYFFKKYLYQYYTNPWYSKTILYAQYSPSLLVKA